MNIHKYWGFCYLIYFSFIPWTLKILFIFLHLLSWWKISFHKLILLGLLAAVTIYLRNYYGTVLDIEASGAFMLSLFYLKEIEGNEERDKQVLFLLAILALGVGSIFLSNFFVFILFLFHFFFLLYSRQPNFKIVAGVFLGSLPMAVWVFLFFPRTQLALVGFRPDPKAYVGFSKELRLDLYDSLSLNHNLVMSIEAKKIYLNNYWRGEVLDTHDGLNWIKRSSSLEATFSSGPSNWTGQRAKIELAKQYENHLFVPDYTSHVVLNASVVQKSRSDFVWKAPERQKVYQYEVYFGPEVPVIDQAGAQRRFLQRVPQPEKIKTLALSLLPDFERNLKRYFKEQAFTYVLDPGKIQNLSEFLFFKKRGYCSHYAAATAILAREAGIPSRVVMGFLGGELNTLGNYVAIKESDAHAWVELYLDGRWKRIDPTLFVASRRGSESGSLFYGGSRDPLLRQFEEMTEYLNRQWIYFTQEYDSETQETLARKSIFEKINFWMVGTIFFSLFILMIILFVLYLNFKKTKLDAYQIMAQKFIKKIKYQGEPFPLEVLKELNGEGRDLWERLNVFRFSSAPSKEEWKKWKRDFRRWKG